MIWTVEEEKHNEDAAIRGIQNQTFTGSHTEGKMCWILGLVQTRRPRNPKILRRAKAEHLQPWLSSHFFLFFFVLCTSKSAEGRIVSVWYCALKWLAKKFQLCSSHVTLKMACKCCLDILLLMNQSAAGSKTRRNRSRIRQHHSEAAVSESVTWTMMRGEISGVKRSQSGVKIKALSYKVKGRFSGCCCFIVLTAGATSWLSHVTPPNRRQKNGFVLHSSLCGRTCWVWTQ